LKHLSLFSEAGGQPSSVKRIETLPVSVLEIGAQEGGRRGEGLQDSKSSRSEYSHFPREVASLCYELFLRDATRVFDPFAGWGERHAFAREFGKNYTGFDCSQKSIDEARKVYGVDNTLADSRTDPIPDFDGLITCPPYWNLERYSKHGLDGLGTWDDFCDGYGLVLRRCYNAAKPGAKLCIMVGDWRKSGRYYGLCHLTRSVMLDAGAETFDEVVVSRLKVSKVKVMMPQAVRLGYTVKVNENLLVFAKPVAAGAMGKQLKEYQHGTTERFGVGIPHMEKVEAAQGGCPSERVA
jgi:hypothetical protein